MFSLMYKTSQQQRFIAAAFPTTLQSGKPVLERLLFLLFVFHMAINTRNLQEKRTNQDSVVNTGKEKSSCSLK